MYLWFYSWSIYSQVNWLYVSVIWIFVFRKGLTYFTVFFYSTFWTKRLLVLWSTETICNMEGQCADHMKPLTEPARLVFSCKLPPKSILWMRHNNVHHADTFPSVTKYHQSWGAMWCLRILALLCFTIPLQASALPLSPLFSFMALPKPSVWKVSDKWSKRKRDSKGIVPHNQSHPRDNQCHFLRPHPTLLKASRLLPYWDYEVFLIFPLLLVFRAGFLLFFKNVLDTSVGLRGESSAFPTETVTLYVKLFEHP